MDFRRSRLLNLQLTHCRARYGHGGHGHDDDEHRQAFFQRRCLEIGRAKSTSSGRFPSKSSQLRGKKKDYIEAKARTRARAWTKGDTVRFCWVFIADLGRSELIFLRFVPLGVEPSPKSHEAADVTRGRLKKGIFSSFLFRSLSSLPSSTPLSNSTLPSAFFPFKSSNIPSLKQHRDARKGFSRTRGAILKVCRRFFPDILALFVLMRRVSHSSLLSALAPTRLCRGLSND